MRILIVLVILIFLQTSASSQYPRNKVDTCLNLLGDYSNYWKKDSLGENGFRELLGHKVLKNCNCEGRLWKDVKEHLGTPNFSYPDGERVFYSYRLNHFTKDIKDIGTFLLDVVVNKEGVIVHFIVWEGDG